MQWYYAKNGGQMGPVSADEIRAKMASGEIQPGDLAWRDGMSDWLPVSQIDELQNAPEASPQEAAPAAQDPAAPTQATPGAVTPQPGAVAPQPGAVAPQPGAVSQPGAMPIGAPPLGSGKATTSMVLGICGLVFFCIPCVGLILGILAIVFSSQVTNAAKLQPDLEPFLGRAKGGKIMGIIAIVLSILNAIAGVIINLSSLNLEGM